MPTSASTCPPSSPPPPAARPRIRLPRFVAVASAASPGGWGVLDRETGVVTPCDGGRGDAVELAGLAAGLGRLMGDVRGGPGGGKGRKGRKGRGSVVGTGKGREQPGRGA